MENTKITVQSTISAPVSKVWDYWTKPEHITKWNFASDDWECPAATNDLKVGGIYSARMQAKDGSFGFDFDATYMQVDDHKNLTYVMGDGREAATTFDEIDGATQVSTVFDAESQNDVEMQRGGWQAIMDNFKKYVTAS